MNFNEAKQFLNRNGYTLVDEAMTRGEYNKKFDRVARKIWMELGADADLSDVKAQLMDNDEVSEYIADETYSSDEIALKWLSGDFK